MNVSPEVTAAYHVLRETVDQQLQKSAYCTIALCKLFVNLKPLSKRDEISHQKIDMPTVQVAASLAE